MQDVGLMTKKDKETQKREWTGKWGIHSEDDFLANPTVQERALVKAMENYDRYLAVEGAKRFIGQRIEGKVAPFDVTLNGLLAAAHRHGARAVRGYLDHLADHDWRSEEATFGTQKDVFLAIETRLRTFAKIPYE